jgi:hypothetical protein
MHGVEVHNTFGILKSTSPLSHVVIVIPLLTSPYVKRSRVNPTLYLGPTTPQSLVASIDFYNVVAAIHLVTYIDKVPETRFCTSIKV